MSHVPVVRHPSWINARGRGYLAGGMVHCKKQNEDRRRAYGSTAWITGGRVQNSRAPRRILVDARLGRSNHKDLQDVVSPAPRDTDQVHMLHCRGVDKS